jgi:hypothetical protein
LNAQTDCIANLLEEGVNPGEMQLHLSEFKNCGHFDVYGTFVPTKELLNAIQFDENNLSCLRVKDTQEYYYVNKSGKSHVVKFFDNGCDYFSEGIARGKKGKYIFFFDMHLRVKLRIEAFHATPFEDGKSQVCPAGELRKNEGDEHTEVVCKDDWYVIDKTGKRLQIKSTIKLLD